MSDDVLATTDDGRFRVRLVLDEHPTNPRTDDETLVHVITIDTHLGQYHPVDKDGGPLAHIWERLKWNRWTASTSSRATWLPTTAGSCWSPAPRRARALSGT
ncbi:hypothetical protein [Streptomyces sp. A5-4]|uniref:hypothetical protein n=1 Tax=Streptomyces sp. A5-4 TaxID=3384771 RepID=UPI003DA8599E